MHFNEPVCDNGVSRADAGSTAAEVAERYMHEHVKVRCKPTTARQCRLTLGGITDKCFFLQSCMMVRGLGGRIECKRAPFTPEAGACEHHAGPHDHGGD